MLFDLWWVLSVTRARWWALDSAWVWVSTTSTKVREQLSKLVGVCLGLSENIIWEERLSIVGGGEQLRWGRQRFPSLSSVRAACAAVQQTNNRLRRNVRNVKTQTILQEVQHIEPGAGLINSNQLHTYFIKPTAQKIKYSLQIKPIWISLIGKFGFYFSFNFWAYELIFSSY